MKIQGKLLLKKQVADIVSLIILEFKDKFKNIDLIEIQKDYDYIKSLMAEIEKKCADPTLMDKENLENLDKNEILKSIIKAIFPSITSQELETINVITGVIMTNKIVKPISRSFVKRILTLCKKQKKNL